MALQSCPECAGPLSSTAPVCPRCGWDRDALLRQQIARQEYDAVLARQAQQQTAQRCGAIRMQQYGFIPVFVLCGMGVWTSLVGYLMVPALWPVCALCAAAALLIAWRAFVRVTRLSDEYRDA